MIRSLVLTLLLTLPAACSDRPTVLVIPTAPSASSPVTTTVQTTNPTTPIGTTPIGTNPTTPIGTNPTTPIGTTPTRPPDILLFAADTTRLLPNVGTILRWEVPDAAALVRIDPYPGNVGNVGATFVLPALTTTYTLTARNAAGTSIRAVLVIVDP